MYDIDKEDLEAVIQHLKEHIQYDEDDDATFWQNIVDCFTNALNNPFECSYIMCPHWTMTNTNTNTITE